MAIPEELRNLLPDAEVNARLTHLYLAALRTDPALRAECAERGIDEADHSRFYDAMREAYMPVTPELGKLLYALVRTSRARTVLEFGTSFGISTIFLAAGLRAGGGGRVITVERDAHKAERARDNLRAAGLSAYVEQKCGDARTVFSAGSWGSVDLLFLDGPKPLYLDVLRLVEPHLREGALVISDNSEMQSAQAYLAYLRAPENDYTSVSFVSEALGSQYRHELAVRGRGGVPGAGLR